MTGVLPVLRALATVFSDAHRQCGTLKISNDRDACLAKARMNYAQKKIQIMKKGMTQCGETKNPDKCKLILAKNIKKEEATYNKQKQKLQKLMLKGRTHGEEPAKMIATRV